MRVHLVNPSSLSFGVGVIVPRWLYVLAAATPDDYGDPFLTDETLEPMDIDTVRPGDAVGIGIHTSNALRGYELGEQLRRRGAFVIFGGVHATLYPEEALDLGSAHAVVKGDGEVVWKEVLADCAVGAPRRVYDGGRIEADQFLKARWSLLPPHRYMWASVQTVRGCPKHCSFCSVWRTDGQRPRQRRVRAVLEEITDLRRQGFRFVALADDNFYPVTLTDLDVAARRTDRSHLDELSATRAEKFALMAGLSQMPHDMVFLTQITMEAAEDPEYLEAMRRAHIRGALVGVEAVTAEGLKDIYKDFNASGDRLVQRLQAFRDHGVQVLGSFIFGLPSDRPETFDLTADIAARAGIAFAQFVPLTPLPGTVDFAEWEQAMRANPAEVGGIPLTRYWLIPGPLRPRVYIAHPGMSPDEIRQRTQAVWDRFYKLRFIWTRSSCITTLKGRLTFVLISKLYRQMYANTGFATDSARANRSATWARWIARPCQRLFAASPMPELETPPITD
jgi:radical SAM superfamily enzyme YgiQ (UPF0313 family)